VPLTRRTGEKHVSWGLDFDEKTLELIECADCSIATRNAVVCACVGLVLLKIDGNPVRNLDCVVRLTEGCTSMKLHFRPAKIISASTLQKVRRKSSRRSSAAVADVLPLAVPPLVHDEQQQRWHDEVAVTPVRVF
jgi:hypothetical protein